MAGKVIEGPVTIRGDLIITGRLNKGLDTAQANNGKALQVIQGVLQPVVTQPNVIPQSGDLRMYGQNSTINGNVVPGGTDGYFQIDEYINGAWQHLFEIMPSTTGNANVLDLFISGRVFARDSILSAPGRFFFKPESTPFGTDDIYGVCYGLVSGTTPTWVAGTSGGKLGYSLDGGATWTLAATNPFAAHPIDCFWFANGIFMAGSSFGQIGFSSDGTHWTLASTNPAAEIYSIAYGNGLWVAVGNSVYTSSNNGVTWVLNYAHGATSITFGNGTFIFCNGTSCFYSIDTGSSWQTVSATTNDTNTITFGNGVFVVGCLSGEIRTSYDNGITWITRSNPFGSINITGISFSSGVFEAVGSNAGLTQGASCRSLDLGLTWGIKYGDGSTLAITNTALYCVAGNAAGHFVVGGKDSSNISIAYSDYVEAGAGIVESGSNSNGSYVKFADGTARAWILTGVINIDTNYTSPVNFTLTLGVSGTCIPSTSWSTFDGYMTTSTNLLVHVFAVGNEYAATIDGRWK